MATGGGIWAISAALEITTRGGASGVFAIGGISMVTMSFPGLAILSPLGQRRSTVISALATWLGLASLLFFPIGLLSIAGLFDWHIYDSQIAVGRRLGQVLLSVGALGLSITWNAIRQSSFLRFGMMLMGLLGLGAALLVHQYTLLVLWLMEQAIVWFLLGVAMWPPRRKVALMDSSITADGERLSNG